jgi:hypothetical protein
MSKPIALSDHQLTTVLAGAEKLKLHVRSKFLELVANELSNCPTVDDGAVHPAVDLILEPRTNRRNPHA